MDDNSRGHLMLEEIREQPRAITRLVELEMDRVWSMAERWRARPPRFIFIAARGTSDHAALYAKYLFETMNGIPVGLAAPSITSIYQAKVNVEGGLLIGISQSGEAADVISVLERANDAGADTLAITNVADSPMASAAKETILLHAHTEHAVAATKTYTSTLASLVMLAVAMGGGDELRGYLEQVPSMIEDVLWTQEKIRARVERFRYLKECVVLGRSYTLGTAYELALKLRETCYIRAQPFASPDFVHGPIAIIEEGFPVIAFANEGATLASVMEVIQRTQERGAEAVVIGNSPEALQIADIAIPVCMDQHLPEVMAPFPVIVAGQIMAQALAVTKGIDPDCPRGLCKVTITR